MSIENPTTEMAEDPLLDEEMETHRAWRRLVRWTVVAIVIALAGLIVGGISLGTQAAQLGRENRQNAWDDATRVHDTCVTQAATRADTISLEHNRFDREASGIDSDESTVDLIEANVMFVGSVNPESPFVQSAVQNIADRRARLQQDRDNLAAARKDFDSKRPPLDPNDCPPPPSGPRP